MSNESEKNDYQIMRQISDRTNERLSQLQAITEGAGGCLAFFGIALVANYLIGWHSQTARNIGFWEAVAGGVLGIYLYVSSKRL